MQITNKKLAFYIATITVALATVGQSFGVLTTDQANTVMAAISMICGAFGLADVGWDYINATRGNFDIRVTETVVTDNPVSPAIETKTVERNVSLPSDTPVTTTVSHSEYAG